MKKTTVFKRALSALAVTGALASMSAPAQAFTEVDPHWRAWEASTYTQFVMKVNNQFYNINQYLADIHAYLTNGDGDTGRGVIGTITKTMDAQRKFSEEDTANEHARMQVLSMNQAMATRVAASISNPRDCYELPKGMGARMGGGGGATAASKGRIETNLAKEGAGTKTSEVAHAAAVYGNHSANGHCTAEDAKYAGVNGGSADRQAFGCTAPGKMPDGDARAQSLFVPAHDYTKADAPERLSLTFDNGQKVNGPSQAMSADETIANIVARFSPPALPKGVEQTPQGRVLLTKQKVFNARLSPAVNALSTIAAGRDGVNNPMSDTMRKSVWGDEVAGVYGRVFPGLKVPVKPSEMEVLRYEVMRRYADYGGGSWNEKMVSNSDPAARSKMQLENQAVQLNLLYQIHSRMEENNAVQAAILSHLVNPITKSDLELAAQGALNSKQN